MRITHSISLRIVSGHYCSITNDTFSFFIEINNFLSEILHRKAGLEIQTVLNSVSYAV